MRVEHKTDPAKHFRRPCLDPADGSVTVFNRKREIAAHEGRAHTLEFALRNPASEHQPFGAATDCTIKCPDPNLARPGFGKRFIADFSAPGADIPKRLGGSIRHFSVPPWTL